LNRVKASR